MWHWMARTLGTAQLCPCQGLGRLYEGLQGPTAAPPLAKGNPSGFSTLWLRESEAVKRSVAPCLEGWDLCSDGCPVVGPWVMGQPLARSARVASLPCPGLHHEETGVNPMKWDEINKAAELF